MDFERAVSIIIEREGGLVDDPRDPGGITNFGISLAAFPTLGREGIRSLTIQGAKELYRREYWDKAQCEKFPSRIRLSFFDCTVNQGVTSAIKTLQKTLKIPADGVIGPQTIRAATRLPEKDLVASFLAERAKFYMALPTFKDFGTGWLVRLFHIAQDVD